MVRPRVPSLLVSLLLVLTKLVVEESVTTQPEGSKP